MKKRFKRLAAVLMCSWNLYMPNTMQEENIVQVANTTPVVEEYVVEHYDDEMVDESKQKQAKVQKILKSIVSFIPAVICGLFSMFGGWLKYPTMMLVSFLVLLLVGWLLLRNKPWASALGIIIGSGMIYEDIADTNYILEESLLGIFLIVYFAVIIYLTIKYPKKERIVIEKV